MNRLILVFVATILLASCVGQQSSIREVDVAGQLITVVKDKSNAPLLAENNKVHDEILDFNTLFDSNSLIFDIKNISNKKVLIHWSESALVDVKGEVHKVYYIDVEGLLNFTKNGPSPYQEPSVLVSGSRITGSINNRDNFANIPSQYHRGYVFGSKNYGYHYIPGTITRGRHFNKGLFSRNKNIPIEQERLENLGKTLKLILAVEVEGKKFDYTFTFKVTNYD